MTHFWDPPHREVLLICDLVMTRHVSAVDKVNKEGEGIFVAVR